MMKTIDVTLDAAEDALVALAAHVPPDVPIGRPHIARGGDDDGVELITGAGDDAVMWFSWPTRAQRLRSIDGRTELVEWRQGVVWSRALGQPSR